MKNKMPFYVLMLLMTIFTSNAAHAAIEWDEFQQLKNQTASVRENLWGVVVPSVSSVDKDGYRPVLAIWQATHKVPWYESEIDVMSCLGTQHFYKPETYADLHIHNRFPEMIWDIKSCRVISGGPRYTLYTLQPFFTSRNALYEQRKAAVTAIIDGKMKNRKITEPLLLGGMLIPILLPVETKTFAQLGAIAVSALTGGSQTVIYASALVAHSIVPLVTISSFAAWIYQTGFVKPELEAMKSKIITNLNKMDGRLPADSGAEFGSRVTIAAYPVMATITDLENEIRPFGDHRSKD